MNLDSRQPSALKVFLDVPNEEYHKMDRLGHSDLLRLSKSPMAYRHSKDNPVDPNIKALVLGSAFHTAVLEPDDFDKNYHIIPPDIDGKGPRTSHYKDEMERMRWERPNRKWLSEQDFGLVLRLAESALAHPVLKEGLSRPHKVEGTAYFNLHRARCKCRPDLVVHRRGRTVDVIDLKSCLDASPEGFAKAAANWGYDVQAEFYTRGLLKHEIKVNKFLFVAVEKTPPFLCGVHEIHPDDFYGARKIIRESCAMYKDCHERDVWPGYGEGVHRLRLPAWRTEHKKLQSINAVDSKWQTVKQISESFDVHKGSIYRILQRELHIERRNFQGRTIINVDSWNEHWVLKRHTRRRRSPDKTKTINGAMDVITKYEGKKNDERQETQKVQD